MDQNLEYEKLEISQEDGLDAASQLLRRGFIAIRLFRRGDDIMEIAPIGFDQSEEAVKEKGKRRSVDFPGSIVIAYPFDRNLKSRISQLLIDFDVLGADNEKSTSELMRTILKNVEGAMTKFLTDKIKEFEQRIKDALPPEKRGSNFQ